MSSSMSRTPIPLPLSGTQRFSAKEHLKSLQKNSPKEHESDLLKAIRNALRGTGVDSTSTVHSISFTTQMDPQEEEELTWDETTVFLSANGVVKKKWTFTLEAQRIQWACIGWMEYSGRITLDHFAQDSSTPVKSATTDNTFGPFFHAQVAKSVKKKEKRSRVPAVFVFLRNIGKIYLENGVDFTFALPYIVRKAWPLSPHGVLIQRVLEPSELTEAESTGDDPLPTIFSLQSPFSEPSAVSLTTGIVGGPKRSPSLIDHDENSTKPLKALPATETVLWTSHRGLTSPHELIVTLDAEKRQLTVWRYVYIRPKDKPILIGKDSHKNDDRSKRMSLAGGGSRRSSMIIPSAPEDGLAPTTIQVPLPEVPLASLPGMPPALSSMATMESIANPNAQPSYQSQGQLGELNIDKGGREERPRRKNSLTRADLTATMNRMALNAANSFPDSLIPIEQNRMRTAVWVEKLYVKQLEEADVKAFRSISISLFDHRWDGKIERSLMAICLPASQTMTIFTLSINAEGRLKAEPINVLPAISIAPVHATRPNVWDLLVLKPNHELSIMTHGIHELPVKFAVQHFVGPNHVSAENPIHRKIVSIANESGCSAFITFTFEDGWFCHDTVDLQPQDLLTQQALQIIAHSLPSNATFELHRLFFSTWAQKSFRTSDGVEFDCFVEALYKYFDLNDNVGISPPTTDPWEALQTSTSRTHYREDPIFQVLKGPSGHRNATLIRPTSRVIQRNGDRYKYLVASLYALHTLGEQLRVLVHRYACLLRLVPVVCRIAMFIRPEWADYWRRLCPDALSAWPWPSSGTAAVQNPDDSIPVWPPDISSILFGRVSNPEWKVPWFNALELAERFKIHPSCAYGRLDPLEALQRLTAVFRCLSDPNVSRSPRRAENAVKLMVETGIGEDFISKLPLGIAAPLKEAARSCQLAPPTEWPLAAYTAIGREDVGASVCQNPDVLSKDGYLSMKEYTNPNRPRRTINQIVHEANTLTAGEVETSTGVELDLEEFTSVRFGQDRRLEEVARMLCSSVAPTIKNVDRPDLNEHDQAKEQQHHVTRVAERTLALAYGRAMFTFGSMSNISKETFKIPKIEFSVKFQPLNITVALEHGKISPENIQWGEFHNGVAAALRLSSSSATIDSSWIAFNKPGELTPEHAGFLYGLGLTGHLKGLFGWHTFSYLAPKHDFTSIGVLLGLAAANLGNGNQHVTKMISVHNRALLPTPDVDLGVTLLTQTAANAALGLLYMGTKNRRMAEVSLQQISRKDLVQQDISTEYREAYAYTAALAFGMIMLGKGTTIPADAALLQRLTLLIHGEPENKKRPSFDINLTSPAASIALGLMYLRTERQDIADILAIPDTPQALHRVQPSFLLLRTLARSLIMWNKITPSNEWIAQQIPQTIRKGIENRNQYSNTIADAWELAYYNIIAGCCFAIGLKYAGTAGQEAYKVIIRYNDLFTRMVFSNGPSFDFRIKRSAVRDGLNLITIALSMVMAGTGEITCLKRLRYAYGMYAQTLVHPSFKFGIHVSTHQAMGLLFLGGGRYTLGTSNAAIACMVAAFFPRVNNSSSDNKSYLQPLRHLWVLAVEPRCLIVRDVETKEIVYLPLKIHMREGKEQHTTQLISPTLIPDLDRLVSIRVDTPRYWPFHLDIANIPSHRESLLRSQTLYVKRRTAFLSYTEDPRGSRSLFVRSRSSAGDAATLDFPQLTDTKTHPAGDLWEFITSFSNDPLFLAFADHFCCINDGTDQEKLLNTYCHAVLFDSILQGKPQTLQSHLTLFRYRTMKPTSRYFHLRLQDLRFTADFYSKIFERRFSGRSENNPRTPLIRDSTVYGSLYVLDRQLDVIRSQPEFLRVLGTYAVGRPREMDDNMASHLAWYLQRNAVPVSTLLVVLKGLATDAHNQCLGAPPPEGTNNGALLDTGIREVLHATGTRLTTVLGSGWSVRSLDEILKLWQPVA
ncbi:hypothetical protein K435DRAFT_960693 [Dendrothele bispora CBS 962.96]|uniref:Uncharacterized protein n=1 Tax=Dendrothele bispora (strain CBS 962.96) TaxID=1314807 RepID=A0A4S8MTI3_DENBC|nr:hypothetical protein K435DRAFT_960693 [Dendrothele bispora CBS 962.96]